MSKIAYLAVHFLKDIFDHIRIVRGIAELLRILPFHKFHIRHIDVDDVFKQPNHLN